MAFLTTCGGCSMGDHNKHQDVVTPAPEGGFGGSLCPCDGECEDL